MRALTASELLNAWERGRAQPPYAQALTLLEAACPDDTREALAALSIGRRDASLWALRETLFGPQLVGVAGCPACGERLELSFDTADIYAGDGPPDDPHVVRTADYGVTFRLPTSRDLTALEQAQPSDARQYLLRRCIVSAEHDGETVAVEELPAHVLDAVTLSLAEADPQADVVLNLSCPTCGHEWSAMFDIVSYLWREIDAWAQRTLYEVHVLASAYGWREAEILALSPRRRQLYIEMVNK